MSRANEIEMQELGAVKFRQKTDQQIKQQAEEYFRHIENIDAATAYYIGREFFNREDSVSKLSLNSSVKNNSSSNSAPFHKKDQGGALFWFQKALDLNPNNPDIRRHLGLCYLNGYGTAKNKEKAEEYLGENNPPIITAAVESKMDHEEKKDQDPQQKAQEFIRYIDQIDSDLAYQIGLKFFNSDCQPDYDLLLPWFSSKRAEQPKTSQAGRDGSFFWFQKAAYLDFHNADAQFYLGRCYHYGYGNEAGDKDHQKAVFYYQKAADQGQVGALNGLGIIEYLKNKHPEKYNLQGFNFFQKAADKNNSFGRANLALCNLDIDEGMIGWINFGKFNYVRIRNEGEYRDPPITSKAHQAFHLLCDAIKQESELAIKQILQSRLKNLIHAIFQYGDECSLARLLNERPEITSLDLSDISFFSGQTETLANVVRCVKTLSAINFTGCKCKQEDQQYLEEIGAIMASRVNPSIETKQKAEQDILTIDLELPEVAVSHIINYTSPATNIKAVEIIPIQENKNNCRIA
jgi:TPR repeat protein